jgi:hypothetical protein
MPGGTEDKHRTPRNYAGSSYVLTESEEGILQVSLTNSGAHVSEKHGCCQDKDFTGNWDLNNRIRRYDSSKPKLHLSSRSTVMHFIVQEGTNSLKLRISVLFFIRSVCIHR